MRRLVWAILFVAGAASAQAQTVSGPVTFGTGLNVSGTGTVSIATGGVGNAMLANSGLTLGSTALTLGATATTVSGLALSNPTLTGAVTLPGGGTVTSAGLLGIGVNAAGGSGGPGAPLVVDSAINPLASGFGSLIIQGNANKERVDIYSAGPGANPAVQGKGFGGTVASPTATIAASDLFVAAGSGYNGSAFVSPNAAAMIFGAADNWSTSDNGAYITFGTTPMGMTSTARAERLRITAGGQIGVGTTAPGYLLDVQGGQVNASGGFVAAGTAGVTCSGAPTGSFAVTAGIVTHC